MCSRGQGLRIVPIDEGDSSMAGDQRLRHGLAAVGSIAMTGDYVEQLAALGNETRHSVIVRDEGTGAIDRFNCFAYALGIWQSPRFERLVERRNDPALLNAAFVEWLQERGDLLEVEEQAVAPDDIVLYFSGDQLRHAGRIASLGPMTVHSKWLGMRVHSHELWELPLQHGDNARYFRLGSAETVLGRMEQEYR